ncbi:Nedd8 ligase, putative (Cullin neddylation protein, putative), partial [Candida maltosa Xu316]
MSNKAQLKQQFCELTGTAVSTAAKYLDQAKYDLARAIDNFYDKHPNKATFVVKQQPKTVKISKELIQVFEKYQDPNDPNQIDIDGTLKYLEDLDVTPEDLQSLTLAFLLKAPKMGVFTKDNFLNIWQNYSVTDIASMKKFLNKFHKDLISDGGEYEDLSTGDTLTFQKMYDFTFKFSLEVENQKLLDIDSAIEYWKLLIPVILEKYINSQNLIDEDYSSKVNERIAQWYTFLSDNEYFKKKAISFDSWSMFYLFLLEVVLPDPEAFANYDEMAAWP